MMFGAYWRQREREAVATDFLRRPYATPERRWFWHANKIYGFTALMLNGLYQNMPVFLEDNFLILEHKVSFGFVPYPSSVLIYKKSSTGETGLDSPTVMSVERTATKGQSPRLGCALVGKPTRAVGECGDLANTKNVTASACGRNRNRSEIYGSALEHITFFYVQGLIHGFFIVFISRVIRWNCFSKMWGISQNNDLQC